MNYANGKSGSLNTLLSAGTNNPFKTCDKKIFAQRLESMSLEEMGYLCNKLNIRPTTIRAKMEAALLESFDVYQRKQQVYLDDSKSEKISTDGFEELL